MFGQPTQGPGMRVPVSRSAPTSPVAVNGNTVLPPPNATVVVCVLAGTGRADLWLRNNRGQTPLDLCPADQPLRRALIKCCNAAARVRSAQSAVAVVASETGALLSDTAERWSQQSQPQLHNMPPDYTIKTPSHDAYHTQTIASRSGLVKECNKSIAAYKVIDSVQARTGDDHESLGNPLTPLCTSSPENNRLEISISGTSTSAAAVGSDSELSNTNTIDNSVIDSDHVEENSVASINGSNSISMTDNRYSDIRVINKKRKTIDLISCKYLSRYYHTFQVFIC